MIRKRFIVVVAAIAAVAAGAVGTFHSAAAVAGPVAKYVFVPTPIAAAGVLPTTGTVSLTVEAEDASSAAVA